MKMKDTLTIISLQISVCFKRLVFSLVFVQHTWKFLPVTNFDNIFVISSTLIACMVIVLSGILKTYS